MNESINNYVLGRGELHFGQFLPNTRQSSGERYLGNTPELTYTAEQENLEHYSSDHGIRIKDASVILQLDYMGSFVTDNIDPDNLAMFFLGATMEQTATAQVGENSTFEEVKLGQSYQLGITDDSPTGARQVENVAITGAAAGVDFVVDAERGRVTLLEDSTVLVNGDTLDITYDTLASSRSRVISKSTEVEGSMRFLAYNAAGENVDFFMPWVKLSPNGDYALKGDEWQQLSFNLEILKKGAMESVYMDGHAYVLPAGP